MQTSSRWMGALCAVGLALAVAVPAAHAEGAGNSRFQYDELTMQVPAGQRPPGPDAFEQQSAQALAHFAISASLAALQADAGPTRDAALKALNECGAGEPIARMLTGQVTDLLGRANPVAGMLFGMLIGAAQNGAGNSSAASDEAAGEAEAKYRTEAAWRPQLRRISVWDRWLRVDDLDDDSAVIHKPDVDEYLVLDTRQKTWIRLDAAPADALAQRISADPQRCAYTLDRETASIGTRVIDGRAADGYRSVERNPSFSGGATMVLEYTSWLSDQRIPSSVLEVMHGFAACPPGSPAARTRTIPDDRVAPYDAVLSYFEDAAGRTIPRPAGSEDSPDQVTFEQHLRELTEADRDALFSVPPEYRRLR